MKRTLGNRYEIDRMIGTGGMADVYLAYDNRLNREVAVKVLRSDLARDPLFIARFNKEALAAAALNHSGIVSVYDSGQEQTPSGVMPYIVMEHVEGKTLREIINSGEQIDFERALRIIEGVLEALNYSHKEGIIHRDIKPGNIMITDLGEVKVMDFGIARALSDAGSTMTSTWNIVGTAQYLSPEQATGSGADARSDLYSVGCLLFELLAGRTPFLGETPVAIAYQHVSTDVPAITGIKPSLDPKLDDFFKVALAKDPKDRYQSANAMMKDVKRLSRGEAITTRVPRQKKPFSRRSFIAALSAALILLAGISYIVINPSSGKSLLLPNVVGLTESDARSQLIGFTITIQRAHDPRIPKDRIASQIPQAATRVNRGSAVTLTLSDGPGSTTVPAEVVGKPLEEARGILAIAGLLVSKITPVDSEQQPGVVLKVIPDPGSTVDAGTGVELQIASGNVQVPTLVGLSAIEAKTLLTQAGFTVRVVEAYDANQPVGNVLAQAPSAGVTQLIGSAVTITVNTAPGNG